MRLPSPFPLAHWLILRSKIFHIFVLFTVQNIGWRCGALHLINHRQAGEAGEAGVRTRTRVHLLCR